MTTAQDHNDSGIVFDAEDNGFCRVYYRTKGRLLYCWQEESAGRFVYYRCSRDGEPSHEVEPPAYTPRPPGETAIGRDLIAFLDARQPAS